MSTIHLYAIDTDLGESVATEEYIAQTIGKEAFLSLPTARQIVIQLRNAVFGDIIEIERRSRVEEGGEVTSSPLLRLQAQIDLLVVSGVDRPAKDLSISFAVSLAAEIERHLAPNMTANPDFFTAYQTKRQTRS